MKAVILAAGQGKRFREAFPNIPKPMAEIAGKPILQYAVEHVRAIESMEKAYINLYYKPQAIKQYFGSGQKWNLPIEYILEKKLHGTAGVIKLLEKHLFETFVVYYGDNLCSFDLKGMYEFHKSRRGIATILISKSYDKQVGGAVTLDNQNRVVRFEEKNEKLRSTERYENGGVYFLDPKIHNYIPKDVACDFGKDVFPALLKAGETIYCYKAEGFVRGIDTPQRYRNILNEIRGGRIKLQ
jgi:mannose-1-phosphate guanylyltransferase/phosphomannomutase